MFWVIDGDADLLPEFNLDHVVNEYDLDCVPCGVIKFINDLVYGYGGVKLLPRRLTMNVDVNSSDMTINTIGPKAMPDVSNVTCFNTDEFSTWKSAFRECAKLSSKTINRQEEGETNERLKIWTKANGRFCEFAIPGANAGMEFEPMGLIPSLINDFDWLRSTFSIWMK